MSEITGAALLFNWLNSATMQIRDSFVAPAEKNNPARVDAAWNHYDPEGFELAVATREYLTSVGYAPKRAEPVNSDNQADGHR